MSTVVTQCHCGARFKVDGTRLGKRAKCPKCGETFEIAVARTPAAKPPVAAPTPENSPPVAAEVVSEPQVTEGRRVDVRVADPALAKSVPIVRELWEGALLNSSDNSHAFDLVVTVTAWDEGSQGLRYLTSGLAGEAVCSLDVRGQADGQAFAMSTTRKRRLAGFGGDSKKMIRSAAQKCLWDVEDSLRPGVSSGPTSLSRTWHFLRVARWLAFVLLTSIASVWNVAITDSGPPGMAGVILGIWMGVLLGGTAFGAMAMVTLMFMPGRFYTRDPVGVRIMKQTGVNSLGMLRVLTAFLAVIFLAVFMLFLVLAIRGES